MSQFGAKNSKIALSRQKEGRKDYCYDFAETLNNQSIIISDP